MKDNEIKTEEVTVVENTPQQLLTLAINKGVDVAQLEKLMELQERWQKSEAEKQFNLAMAAFQKECPVIEKKSVVKDKGGKPRYKFAQISDIIEQTKDLISKNNLFYDFTTEDMNEFMRIICTVTHSSGHSKSTTFKIPIGKEDYMSDVQKYGARLTFGKRYAFCNAFGIITGDEDNDAVEEKVDNQECRTEPVPPTNGKVTPNKQADKDTRPWLSEVAYEKACTRISAGDIELLPKILIANQVLPKHLEELKKLHEFSLTLKNGPPKGSGAIKVYSEEEKTAAHNALLLCESSEEIEEQYKRHAEYHGLEWYETDFHSTKSSLLNQKKK